MAKLVVDVSTVGAKEAIANVAKLREEISRASGITFDGTNAKQIADKLIAIEKETIAVRERVAREYEARKVALAQSSANKTQTIEAAANAKQAADKEALNAKLAASRELLNARLAASAEALNTKLAASNEINNAKINAQNERFYAKEARLATNASNSLFARFGNVRNVLGSIASAAASAFAGLSAAKIVEVNRELETTKIRVDSIFKGNREEVEKFNSDIKSVSENAAVSFFDLQKTALQLKTLGLEPTRETLDALSSAVARVGGNSEVFDGVVRALTQSLNKGKIEQEEMNQLAERGIPAQKLLAEAMGISTDRLIKLQRAGELGRDEINLLITSLKGFGGDAATVQVDSITGKITKLEEAATKAAGELGAGGLNDVLKDTVGALTQAITSLTSGESSFKSFGAAVKAAVGESKLAIGDFLEVASLGFTKFAADNVKIVGFFEKVALGFRSVAPAAQEAASSQQALTNELKLTAGAIDEAAAAQDRQIEAITRAAFEQLKLTASIKDGAGALRILADGTTITQEEFEDLEIASRQALKAISLGLDENVPAVDRLRSAVSKLTTNELASFKLAFENSLTTGVGVTKELAANLEAVKLEQLERQFKNLGLTSVTELTRIRDEAKSSFDFILANASLEEAARAFEVYAERAIAAQKAIGGDTAITENLLLIEARQNGLNATIDATGKVAASSFAQYNAAVRGSIDVTNQLVTGQQQVQQAIASTAAEQAAAHRDFLAQAAARAAADDSERRRKAGQLIIDNRGLSANELELERLLQIQAQSNPNGIKTGQEEKFRIALADAQAKVSEERRAAQETKSIEDRKRRIENEELKKREQELRNQGMAATVNVNLDGKQVFNAANRAKLVRL